LIARVPPVSVVLRRTHLDQPFSRPVARLEKKDRPDLKENGDGLPSASPFGGINRIRFKGSPLIADAPIAECGFRIAD
jgi:hypothetical protein